MDNESSDFFTIIEIFTHDFPGLLYRITNSLFQCRLDVWVAKIATKADQVVDVFYVRDFDGQKVDSPEQVAAVVRAGQRLGLRGGVLVAVPPPEASAMSLSAVEAAIGAALADAAAQQIRGKALTPFLLARVADLTGGESMAANIALLRNNAAVAAQIAVALTRS